MTLVKSKTRVSAQKRKLSAGHHRQDRRYLKTYWPYIPILAILGGSLVANQYLPTKFSSNQVSYSGATTRFASLTGNHSSLIVGALSLVLLVLVAYYIARHLKRLKKLVMEGEQFLAKHYSVDMLLAILIGGLYILVR